MKKSPILFTLLAMVCFSSLGAWADDLRITEFMYTGHGNEFFELTNMGSTAIDMTGWSYDDESANAGKVDLSDLGVIAPGESVILTTDKESDFISEWGLSGVKVLRYWDAYLGTNDQINIYSPADELVDCLTYGHNDFPESVRTKYQSAFPVTADIGTDNIYRWLLSRDGDVSRSYASMKGDIGNPGFVEHIVAQKDLGFGGPGKGQFWVYGPEIATGNRVDVLLRRASGGKPAFLFFGIQNNPTPVKGGIVVPAPPTVTLVMVTTPSNRCHDYGEIYFTTDCGGGPATVFAQFIYVDSKQCLGYGFSNALELDIQP